MLGIFAGLKPREGCERTVRVKRLESVQKVSIHGGRQGSSRSLEVGCGKVVV